MIYFFERSNSLLPSSDMKQSYSVLCNVTQLIELGRKKGWEQVGLISDFSYSITIDTYLLCILVFDVKTQHLTISLHLILNSCIWDRIGF